MRQKKVRNTLAAAVLAMAVAMSASGCGQKTYELNTDVISVNGENVIDYGVANAYTRVTQADTYQYMKLIYNAYGMNVGNLWSQQEQNEEGEYESYGETFKNNVLESLKKMLLCDIYKEDYDVTLTEEEKGEIKEIAKEFMEKTDAKVIGKMHTDESSMEEMLRLLTIQQKVKEEVMKQADHEVSEEAAGQTTIQYVKVEKQEVATEQETEAGTEAGTDETGTEAGTESGTEAETEDGTESGTEAETETETEVLEPEQIAEKILKALEENGDFNTAVSEAGLSAETLTYTTADPGDEMEEDMLEHVKDLKDGEYDSYLNPDGSIMVVYMQATHDEAATEEKKQEIIDTREENEWEDTVSKWEESHEIDVNEAAWKSIKVSDNAIFKKMEAETETETGSEADTETGSESGAVEAETGVAETETEDESAAAEAESETVKAAAETETESESLMAADETENESELVKAESKKTTGEAGVKEQSETSENESVAADEKAESKTAVAETETDDEIAVAETKNINKTSR